MPSRRPALHLRLQGLRHCLVGVRLVPAVSFFAPVLLAQRVGGQLGGEVLDPEPPGGEEGPSEVPPSREENVTELLTLETKTKQNP